MKDAPASRSASIEARRALVRRVVASTAFAKSERLSSFLACVCDLTLSGRASEINEQKIGTTVFGRPPDYDSSIDGIVRPQASRLRQRLDLYFSGEGSGEPIRITLPKGSYVPVFEINSERGAAPVPLTVSGPIAAAPMPPEEIIRPSFPIPRKWLVGALSGILICLLLAAVIGVSRHLLARETAASIPPARNPLWSQLFRPDQTTIVVPSDTGLVMWQGATGQSVDLAKYLSGGYRAQSTGDRTTGQIDPGDLASRRYTSIVDLDIASGLTRIADSHKSRLELTYARDVRPEDLKVSNVVLIGATAANPWVELFEPKMNFVFSNARLRQYTVVNRKPVGEEPASWAADYDDVKHRVYGVVAFLPNLSGAGNVLILEGTSMAGTECAWDFVADDSSFRQFVNRIRRPDGTTPHFQLVLDSINLTGSSLQRGILAWRTMD